MSDNLGPHIPDREDFTDVVREAITDCNGSVWAGDELEAQIRLIRWMRHNPTQAATILEIRDNDA